MGGDAARGRWDTYVAVLTMLAVTFFFGMAAPDEPWAFVAATVLQSGTLALLLWVSRAHRGFRRVATVLIVAAIAASIVGAANGTDTGRGLSSLTTALLAAAGPVLIVRGIRRRSLHVDVETVAAALSIYLMIGLFYSYLYAGLDIVDPPVFTQTDDATRSEVLYFSFITQTTVGYGDFSAAGNTGRALAVSQAVLGQIYLVTIVALIVSNLGRPSRRSQQGGGDDAPDDG
jgi:hypothetical protein